MIKITTKKNVMMLEGRVTSDDLELLDREIVRHLQSTHELVVDMKGIKTLDNISRQWFQDSLDKRVVIRNQSIFVGLLLKRE